MIRSSGAAQLEQLPPSADEAIELPDQRGPAMARQPATAGPRPSRAAPARDGSGDGSAMSSRTRSPAPRTQPETRDWRPRPPALRYGGPDDGEPVTARQIRAG